MNRDRHWLVAPIGARQWIGAVTLLLVGMANAQVGTRYDRDYYDPKELEDINIYRNVELHIPGGYNQLKAKRYRDAYADAEFILRYYTNQPKALLMLSDICVKWKSPECDADGWFERAIERNPSIAQTRVLYGLHLHRVGRHKQALEAYKAAIQLDPSSMYAHYNMGLLYFDMGEFTLSNESAQRSYSLGAPYPGLRAKLEKAGKWQPLPQSASVPERAPEGSPGAGPQQQGQ